LKGGGHGLFEDTILSHHSSAETKKSMENISQENQ